MNRRLLKNKRHKFIKTSSFNSRNNYLTGLKKDLIVVEKQQAKIEEKITEIKDESRFPDKQQIKKKKVMRVEKVKVDRRAKSLRELIDEEERKLEALDAEENTLELLDKLE